MVFTQVASTTCTDLTNAPSTRLQQLRDFLPSRWIASLATVTIVGACFSPALFASPSSVAAENSSTTIPADCEPLTEQTAALVAQGKIFWTNPSDPGHVLLDSLLLNHAPLDPQADDDGDELVNSAELCTAMTGYTDPLTGQELPSLFYRSHPLLADTDGDGVSDSNDAHPLRWDTSARDAIMFQELSYRTADYVRTVLDNERPFVRSDWHKDRAEYDVFHRELAPYWEVEKVWDTDDGFDATLFRFSNKTLPFLEDGGTHILGVRGTGGDGGNDGDLANDVRLGLGIWPWQADTALTVADELTAGGYKNLSIAGHSLGGYLAQIISVRMAGQRYADPSNNPLRENYNQFDKNKKDNPQYVKTYTFNAPGMNGSRWLWEYRNLGTVLSQLNHNENYKTRNDSVPGNLEPTIWLDRSDGGHSSRSFMEARYTDQPGFSIGLRRGFQADEGYRDPLLNKSQIFLKPTTIEFVYDNENGERTVLRDVIVAKTQEELTEYQHHLPTDLIHDYGDIINIPNFQYGQVNQVVVSLKEFPVTYTFVDGTDPVGTPTTIVVHKFGGPYSAPAVPRSPNIDWTYEIANTSTTRTDTGEPVEWIAADQPNNAVPVVDTAAIDAPTTITITLRRVDAVTDIRIIFVTDARTPEEAVVKEMTLHVKPSEAMRGVPFSPGWVPVGWEAAERTEGFPTTVNWWSAPYYIPIQRISTFTLPKTGSTELLILHLAGVLVLSTALFLQRRLT